MNPLCVTRRVLCDRSLLSSYFKCLYDRKCIACRHIATGKQNSDTASVKQDISATHVVSTSKNWMSFGYDMKNEAHDKNSAHATMFFSVTLCIVIGGFFFTYMPDYKLRDWAQREAYLQLRFREQNGLPLIDPSYVDPAGIDLPSDEELGDTEIII